MSKLKKEDLIFINRTGEQLKNVIRHLMQEFPSSAESISGLSSWLGINRSNSQRLLNAVRKSKDGADVLCMLPGLAGIEEFIQLCRKKNLNSNELEKAKKALESFGKCIKQYSRSHSDLKRLLKDSSDGIALNERDGSNIDNRRQQYESMKALIGESTEFLFTSFVLTVKDSRPKYLQEYAIVSKQNIDHGSKARPFFQYYSHNNLTEFTKPELINKNSKLLDEEFQVSIVEDFSSDQLIEGYSGYSEEHSCLVFNNIDRKDYPLNGTFFFSNPDDIVNPLDNESHSSSTAISIKNPTEHLIMMVFMERQLDIRSTVNVGCYTSNSSIQEGNLSIDDVWSDRLPEFPELKIINKDSPLAEESSGKKYGDLIDFVFDYSGLSKDDFVCYMMEVPYPIWSTCYRIYFEHS
ncbi:MAG: hypothetical protein KUG81_01260 [Gammaproteobacteria bacterium]|nr:hypothetical protein [Gammaproteobacteria bacterium]